MKKPIFQRYWVVLAIASILSVGIYLILSNTVYKIGFPLDDAWIHQTYARNLVDYRQWSFIPGQNTSGSTSPLWTILLSIAYLLHLNFYFWTFLLGTACLFVVAFLAESIAREKINDYPAQFPWVGIFISAEWHLAWAAGSGMETLLLAAFFLAILYFLLKKTPQWWVIGALAGVSIWIRPEGITWLGPISLILLLQREPWAKRLSNLGKTIGCFLPFAAGYLYFNKLLSGTMFPNTFYAKQVEYAVQLQQPFLTRFFSIGALPFIGSAILLVPGIIFSIYCFIREKDWKMILTVVWVTGYIVIYALVLPVTYQYGRYIMPIMPVLFLVGLLGTIRILQLANYRSIIKTLKKGWVISIILLSAGFFVIGGKAFSDNVRLIESEMVECSQWISQNTPPDSLIAAHDIGALGYFGNRKIIDLAGLISPDIIPIIRNEELLSKKLDELEADYLMTFPSWYKTLPEGKPIVFTGGVSGSNTAGSDNMTVYQWKNK